MNINILPLLCSFLLASSLCASQADPIDKKLEKVNGMYDDEALCFVIPYAQNEAEKNLVQCKEALRNQSLDGYERVKTVKHAEANKRKSVVKYNMLAQEIALNNNDYPRLSILYNKLKQASTQFGEEQNKERQAVNSIDFNDEAKAVYDYTTKQLNVFRAQASLLLVQKEKLEQKQVHMEQEIHQLRAELKDYKKFVKGRQIEVRSNL